MRTSEATESHLRSRTRVLPGARVPALAAVAAIFPLIVDLPRAFSLGPITLSGLITIAVACVALVSLLFLPAFGRTAESRGLLVAANRGFAVFLVIVLIATLVSVWTGGINGEGVQNVAVYGAFVGSLLVLVRQMTVEAAQKVWKALRSVCTLAAYLYLANQLLGLGVFSPRPMALAAVIVLAVVVPGAPINIAEKLAPYAAVLAVALSLSRTATVIAVFLLVFVVLRKKRGGRLARAIGLSFLALAGLILLFIFNAPFRDRFLIGDNAVQVDGLSFSTQGRLSFWESLISHSYDSPWIGHGPGAAERLIAITSPGQSHPHNDFLRLYYDFGIVGLTAFLLAYLGLTLAVARNARRTNEQSSWSALLALAGTFLVALTDNPLVYVFIMMPLALVVAISIVIARQSVQSSFGALNSRGSQ